MKEFPVTVQPREEETVIPQGVSCTETLISFYIRIRADNKILTIRIMKESLEPRSWRLESND